MDRVPVGKMPQMWGQSLYVVAKLLQEVRGRGGEGGRGGIRGEGREGEAGGREGETGRDIKDPGREDASDLGTITTSICGG